MMRHRWGGLVTVGSAREYPVGYDVNPRAQLRSPAGWQVEDLCNSARGFYPRAITTGRFVLLKQDSAWAWQAFSRFDGTLCGDGVRAGMNLRAYLRSRFGLIQFQFFLDVSIRVMLFLVVNISYYGG